MGGGQCGSVGIRAGLSMGWVRTATRQGDGALSMGRQAPRQRQAPTWQSQVVPHLGGVHRITSSGDGRKLYPA